MCEKLTKQFIVHIIKQDIPVMNILCKIEVSLEFEILSRQQIVLE